MELKTVKETARELRMTTVWVRQKIHAGKIRCVRMGGKYFVPRDEVNRCKTEGVE
ncbi:MAG: helix-turn-helix domain-containing protein [Candidatus Syntrophoarchaeum sp.]|nr:helix-turn-helix domain-containing protein [Candidatus Syntrophoarchaeum sp.]